MDRPRAHRDPEFVEAKLARLGEPHVAPLSEFVKRLRESRPDAAVPWLDPDDAGVNARILILLEAPGPKAALDHGSGFVSAHNDDQTAANMWQLFRETGLDRATEALSWNVVPWYLGDGKHITAARTQDLQEARQALRDLLDLLPEVRVVVLLGKAAARAWAAADAAEDLHVIEAAHPSPRVMNTMPHKRDEIRDALAQARVVAGLAEEAESRIP